jgi:hypothetical protein
MTKLSMAFGVVVVVGVATAWLFERQAQTRLREQNQALQQQLDKWAGLSPASWSSSMAAGKTNNNWCLAERHLREWLRLRGEFGVSEWHSTHASLVFADQDRPFPPKPEGYLRTRKELE